MVNYFAYICDRVIRIDKILSVSKIESFALESFDPRLFNNRPKPDFYYRFTVTLEDIPREFTFSYTSKSEAIEDRDRLILVVNQELNKLMEHKHDRL